MTPPPVPLDDVPPTLDGRQTNPSSDPPRTLLITGELPPGPGGIGAHAWALASGLTSLGWELHVVGPQDYVDDQRTRAFNASAPFPLTRLSGGRVRTVGVLRRIDQVRRAVRAHRPELVVTSGGAATMLWALARATGAGRTTRTAVVVHGTELAFQGPRGFLYRRVLRSADSVVAVSELVADRARALLAEPVAMIHNGADPARILAPPGAGEDFRHRHHLGDRPLVLAVGNITERKGQHLLIDALPQIAAGAPDVCFVCVGRPTEAASLQERARALGVEDHLVVLGQVDDDEIAAAFAAADITTMTSATTADGDIEGYGIAITEGAFAGVPAVVSSGTGAAEAIVDGETGFAVSPDRIAWAVTRLLDDADLRDAMGAAARRRALEESTWTLRVAQYASLWYQIHQPDLVIVSHTEHWRDGNRTVSFGPTTREVDALATMFRTVRHVAPLHSGAAPPSAIAPTALNVCHVPLAHGGGGTWRNRVRSAVRLPRWVLTITREVRRADVVHVRVPTGIAFAAFPVLTVLPRPRPRWVKYAGTWLPSSPDARVYRVQRAWIRSGALRASVTVNGTWPDQPSFVHPFDNPTLTESDLAAGAMAATTRSPSGPFTIVFAGRLEPEKGAERAGRLVLALRARGYDARGEFVGDGPSRPQLERLAEAHPDVLVLHGWRSRADLAEVYRRAHILILPTTASEGFPKVIAEALAYGIVPVCTDLGAIGQVLRDSGGAVTLTPTASDDDWIDAMATLADATARAPRVAEGLASADRWSYARYLVAVRAMLERDWGVAFTGARSLPGTPPAARAGSQPPSSRGPRSA